MFDVHETDHDAPLTYADCPVQENIKAQQLQGNTMIEYTAKPLI